MKENNQKSQVSQLMQALRLHDFEVFSRRFMK